MTTPRAARCSGVRVAVGVAAGGGLGRKWKTTGRPDAEVKTKGKWFWALDCWLLPALATLAHRFNLFFKATDRREAGRAVKNNLTIMLKERQLIHGKRAKGGNDGKGGAKPQQSGFQKRDKLFGIWHVVDWLFFWQSYGWWLAVSIVAIICKAVSTPFRRRPFTHYLIFTFPSVAIRLGCSLFSHSFAVFRNLVLQLIMGRGLQLIQLYCFLLVLFLACVTKQMEIESEKFFATK